jgi:ABC-type sugar transport system ATPase subunit
MFLGHELKRYGLLDEGPMELAARKTLEDLHATTVRSIRQPVASLSGGQRQSVAVAKAMMAGGELSEFDPPTVIDYMSTGRSWASAASTAAKDSSC